MEISNPEDSGFKNEILNECKIIGHLFYSMCPFNPSYPFPFFPSYVLISYPKEPDLIIVIVLKAAGIDNYVESNDKN